jgi:hypothetical protein
MLWFALQRLASGNVETRKKAAEALGRSKNPRAIPPLVEVLRSDSWQVWPAVARSVMQINPLWGRSAEAAGVVTRFIGEVSRPYSRDLWEAGKETQVRGAAVRALGEIGDNRAVAPLLELARGEGEDTWVRLDAMKALVKTGSPDLTSTLARALTARSSTVRKGAAELLEAAGWRPSGDREALEYKKAKYMCWEDMAYCFGCGRRVEKGESIFGAANVISMSRPVSQLRQDLVLYRGSICFRCNVLYCVECLGKRVDLCPLCKGSTEPAYQKHLSRLQQALQQ